MENHFKELWIKYFVFLRFFLANVEIGFGRLGKGVGRYPKLTIFICLSVVGACSVGFMRFHQEQRTDKLFVPKNSEAERALKKGAPYFQNRLNTRYEDILVRAKDGQNVLTQQSLNEVYNIVQSVQSIDGYAKLCTKVPEFLRGSERFSDKVCQQINIFECLEKFDRTSVYRSFANGFSTKLMSNGKLLAQNLGEVMTDFKFNVSSKIVSANALRILFLMNNQDTTGENAAVLEWERKFIARMDGFRRNSSHLDINYAAERSMDDAIIQSSSSDIGLISITFTVMITFACLTMAKFVNPVRGHNWLAISGVMCTALGILSGIGLSMVIGLPFISLVGVAPFLVVSIGIDDMFILVDEFDREPNDTEPNQRVSNTLTRVGATITMTTITDVIAFFISATSSFPAIQYFCIYTAFCITFSFLLQITLFVALMTFDSLRISRSRCDMLPCLTVGDKTGCGLENDYSISAKVLTKHAEILLTPQAKVTVVLFTLAMFACGILGCLHIDTTFNRQSLALSTSRFARYINVYESTYPQTIAVSIQNTNKLNYSDPNIRREISHSIRTAYNTGYYEQRNSSWVDAFEGFAKDRNTSSDGIYFKKAITDFLQDPRFKHFNLDIALDSKQGNIIASRLFVYYKHSTNSNFHKNAMLRLRKDLRRKEHIGSEAIADTFVFFEQYAIVVEEMLSNIGWVSAVIVVVLLPFCVHPLIVFFIFAQFVLLVMDLFALMYAWNVQLNSISMICMVMSVGFAVDYSTHVAHAFVTSQKDSADKRVIEALSTVGGSVLLGGISTFLGMMLTGLASSPIFKIFFKMFVGIIIFGLYNGLILLPVLLSLFSRFIDVQPPSLTISQKAIFLPLKKKRKKNEKSPGVLRNEKPVCVVGLSVNCPTAPTKDDFWMLLKEGRNTVTTYPTNRHEVSLEFQSEFRSPRPLPGKIYVSNGSYLEDIEGFDYMFFGITRSEAQLMDPQQRLLLQGTYEAMEDAGLTLSELQQSTTGVYVGSMSQDYNSVVTKKESLPYLNQFAATGNDRAILANRLSFAFNLSGPSISFDTACSSSMTALTVACDHLRQGTVDVAIVCSANIVLSVDYQKMICAINMLAQDGKCKVFREDADGYGRGEAVIVVILKASDLVSTTDSPYCDILGWGINSDGHAATPITAPSVEGQTRIIKETLRNANVDPNDVQYMEMHGTGTIIGDSVELKSVDGIYGSQRDSHLRIGSVKSNINHTESAAGLAGLAKVCLMMTHQEFVPTVGVDTPAARLGLEQTKLKIQKKNEIWPENKTKGRIAALNSFGFGGSNAHLLIREHSTAEAKRAKEDIAETKIFVLSAKSSKALQEQANQCADWLQRLADSPTNRANVCYSLNERRTTHNVRLAVDASSLAKASQTLRAFVERPEETDKSFCLGKAENISSKVGFVFGGQGSQWLGMAGDILGNAHLAKYMDEVQEITSSFFNEKYDLIAYLTGSMSEKPSQCLVTVQLSIFALQYTVASFLMRHYEVSPTAVSGHSLGDITAAYFAGAIDLRTAINIIVIRAELQKKLQANGTMAAIGISEADAIELMEKLATKNRLCIAAINDLQSVTLSGDEDAIQMVETHLKNSNSKIFFRKLATDKAFHSHHMTGLHQKFVKKLGEVKKTTNQVAELRFYSATQGRLVSREEINEEFWWQNLREKVQFQPAVSAMLSSGINTVVEISPRPIVSYYVKNISRQMQLDNINVIQALPKMSEHGRLQHLKIQCVGKLFTLGYPLSLAKHNNKIIKFIRFPLYPWQKTNLWAQDHGSHLKETSIPLGTPVFVTSEETEWHSEIDLHKFPYIADHKHKSFGIVVPGAFYINLHFNTALKDGKVDRLTVKDINFQHFLQTDQNSVKLIKCLKTSNKENDMVEVKQYNEHGEITLSTATLTKYQGKNEAKYSLHEASPIQNKADLNMTLGEETVLDDNNVINEEEAGILQLAQLSEEDTFDTFQNVLDNSSFDFGKSFRLIDKAWLKDQRLAIRISVPGWLQNEMSDYVIHPVVIDACLQTRLLVVAQDSQDSVVGVPTGVKEISLLPIKRSFRSLYCISYLDDADNFQAKLMDEKGNVIMIVHDIEMTIGVKRHPAVDNLLYNVEWVVNHEDTSVGKKLPVSNFLLLMEKSNKSVENMQLALKNLHVPTDNVYSLALNSAQLRDDYPERLNSLLLEISKQQRPIFVINMLPVGTSNMPLDVDFSMQAEWLCFESTLKLMQILTQIKLGVECKVLVLTPGHQTTNEVPSNTPWSRLTSGLACVLNLDSVFPIICVDNGSSPSTEQCAKALKSLEVHAAKDGVVFSEQGHITQPYIQRMQIDESGAGCNRTIKTTGSTGWYLSWSTSRKSFFAKEIGKSVNLKEPFVEVMVEYISSVNGDYKSVVDNVRRHDSTERLQVFYGKVSASAVGDYQAGDTVIGFEMSRWVRSRIQVHKERIFKIAQNIPPAASTALSGCVVFGHSMLSRMGTLKADSIKSILCLRDSGNFNLIQVTEKLAKRAGIKVEVYDTSGDSLVDYLENRKGQFDCVICSNGLHSSDNSLLAQCLVQDGIFAVLDIKETVCANEYTFAKDFVLVNFKVDIPLELEEACNLIKHQYIAVYEEMAKEIPVETVNAVNLTEENNVYEDKESRGFVCLSLMEPIILDPPSMDFQGLKEDRTYIVIGGAKGLGLATVKWLASRGAENIIATSRSKLTIAAEKEFRRFEGTFKSTRVTHVQADVTTKQGMKILEDSLSSRIGGVINSAAASDDQLFTDISRTSYRKVMAPKVDGTILLHEMLNRRGENVDFFVLYSSVASVLGNKGQASYAAANSFLNGFAEYRMLQLKQPCLAVCWGAMRGGGLIEEGSALESLLEESGFWMLDIHFGLKVLENVLTARPDLYTIWICDINWSRFLGGYSPAESVLFNSVRQEVSQVMDNMVQPDLLNEVQRANSHEAQKSIVLNYLIRWLSGWMRGNAEEIDCNVPFFTYGIDSVSASLLKFEIQKKLHVDLEVFFFLQSETTVLTLATALIDEINKEQTAPEASMSEMELDIRGSSRRSRRGIFNSSRRIRISPLQKLSQPKLELPKDYLASVYVPPEAKAKLFVVHPSHRYAGIFQPMSLGMKFQNLISLYAFGSPEPSYLGDDILSVHRLAEACVDLLLNEQPVGPYFLAGYSFGGMVAVEMATILESRRKHVALVFMIDTLKWIPLAYSNAHHLKETLNTTSLAESLEEQVGMFLSRVACTSLGMSQQEYASLTCQLSNDEIGQLLDRRAAETGANIPAATAFLTSIRYDHEISEKCHNQWYPTTNLYKGDVIYIAAEDCLCRSRCTCRTVVGSAQQSWSRVFGDRLYPLTVPGNHFSMMKQGSLAQNIGRLLALTASLHFRSLFPNEGCHPLHSNHYAALSLFTQKGISVYSTAKTSVLKKQARQMVLKLNKKKTGLKLDDSRSCVAFNLKDILSIQPVNKPTLPFEMQFLHSGYRLTVRSSEDVIVMCYSRKDLKMLTCLIEAVYKIQMF